MHNSSRRYQGYRDILRLHLPDSLHLEDLVAIKCCFGGLNEYKVSIKEKISKLSGWINGPYRALTIVVLAVLLVLFGRDVFESWRVRSEISRLRERKEMLERSIREDSTLLENLDDPEFLEQFAREKFLMRKEGEEVYVIKK